jgi:hypothetical protein
MSYCPWFWGYAEIYKESDSMYILERNDKKIIVFALMAIFVSYCTHVWGAEVIYKAHDTQPFRLYIPLDGKNLSPINFP